MPIDLFESSKRKIARTKEHILDLKTRIDLFLDSEPYEVSFEPDLKRLDHHIHKIKLTKPLPPSLADIAGDAAANLRAALDHAGYAVAEASGTKNPKFSAFPFAGSAPQFENSLGRSKDIPQQIQAIFRVFQPYKGGNNLLWALNEVCVGDKHKMLTPIGTGAIRTSGRVKVSDGFFAMPQTHVWDTTKNEIELITLGPGAKFDYEFDFFMFVAFGEIQVVGGKPAVPILNEMVGIVESILLGIEIEARGLGYFG